MADERYQWLDQEAAERLLRGEPVDTVDDLARRQAERLAKALDTARTPDLPPAVRTGLPGEAAALAAFRKTAAARSAAAKAGATTARTDRVNRAGHADLGHVRLSPVTAPARRWGRSVRYGLAAAVAAVTVGGVAVAAGTGMLPLVGPAPASSVTAGESADPLVSSHPSIPDDPGAPPVRPGGGDGSSGASPSAGTGTSTTAPPTGGPDGRGTGGTRAAGGTTAGTGEESGGTGEDSGGTGKDKGTDPGTTLARDKAVKACRAYRSGKLDATGRTQLTGSLRKGETLRRYCDRILGGGSGTAAGSGQDGSKDDPKDDSQGDNGDKGTGRDTDEHASGGGNSGNGDKNDGKGNSGNSNSSGNSGRAAGTAAGLTAVIPLDIAVTAHPAPSV
ncbi:hypothetical protein ABT154_05285 [Streptomyces sp. NPDC001728]|uniref:hypothetical protein n=1 Tax=Streptomyces sp. NPDC001728 TaxID=3154396 RepID=UPI00332F8134